MPRTTLALCTLFLSSSLLTAGESQIGPARTHTTAKAARTNASTPHDAAEPALAINNLTGEEIKQGFELMFDGRSFEGWRNPGNWEVDGDALHRTGDGGGLTYHGEPLPDDFEFRFEWKVARGGNSGLLYRPGQYEYQILDNVGNAEGRNPRTSAGSLYFCMAPSKDVTRPAGQWNTGRIVCQGTVIQHWVNGQKVVDFDYSDEKWAFEVRLLKLRGADLDARGALLHLQDHGTDVWFRTLRLRSLTPRDDVRHADVIPAPVPPREREAELQRLERIRDKQLLGAPLE